MDRPPLVHIVCYVVSALALGGAVAYILFGEHTWIGIVAVLIAAVLSRVLILNIVHGKN